MEQKEKLLIGHRDRWGKEWSGEWWEELIRFFMIIVALHDDYYESFRYEST